MTGTPVRVFVCGRLAIEAGDLILLEKDFPARHGRLMWVYLVLERRRAIGRDELAGAIWGDEIPDGWDVALNVLASRLRAAIKPVTGGEPAICLKGDIGRYELTLPLETFIDFERAKYGLHLAEAAMQSRDLESAVSESRVAMEIAARGILDGEQLPWVINQRRFLEQLRIHAMECTAEAELRRGNPRLAEREAEGLLSIDALNEAVYRIKMRAATALGNSSGVVRTMEQCRRSLHEQAGMRPSAETERVYQELVERT
jgi:SARP family transcriptional regulator, regulator of embCAB operon